MSILAKRGGKASTLFKYSDIDKFINETLTFLLCEYSDNFKFEYITASVLKVYLNMKKKIEEDRQEHLQQQRILKEKYENFEIKLQEEKIYNNEIRKFQEEE